MIARAAAARFKQAVRAAISLSGGIEGAAATVERSSSLAGTWNNVNDEALPSIGFAFALDAVAVAQGERPPILSALAAEMGHACIRLPDAPEGADALAEAMIDVSAEVGEIAGELREATRDGVIIPSEAARIMSRIDDAHASLAQMRAIAAKQAEG